MPSFIPQSVVDKDHELDTRTVRASEALAKHRFEQILDPTGPQHAIRAYARAVGRNESVISRFAKGYKLYLERQADDSRVITLTILDAIELARQSADQQVFTEAIAEGAEEPVQRIAHPGQRHRRSAIIDQARERAERHGTDAVDEAREIAGRSRLTRESEKKHRKEKAARSSVRFVVAEGKLAKAKRAVLDAMKELEGVDMSDDEMVLMRATVANLTALLNLLDLRLAGSPDIDWDADLARLTGS